MTTLSARCLSGARPIAGIAAAAMLALAGMPAIAATITIGTNTTDWDLSTVRATGNVGGAWTTLVTPGSLPDASTYTLTPTQSTHGHLGPGATDLGFDQLRLDGGAGTATGVQFLRTTFNASNISTATLSVAVDNGVQIFINGQEVAREVSFLGENWTATYPSLAIGTDGTISSVVKFDATFNFTGWIDGENEVVLAGRNPDNEGLNAGGIVFRMDIETEDAIISEPATLAILAIGLLGVAGRASSSKKRALR